MLSGAVASRIGIGIRLTGDPGDNGRSDASASTTYQAWTGTCPTTQAECTEFRDVNDKADPNHPTGRPYFVINDERLDTDSCNGKVDPGRGCVLFRNMGDQSSHRIPPPRLKAIKRTDINRLESWIAWPRRMIRLASR